MIASPTWTAAEDATLTAEWTKGTSARQIARMLWTPEHQISKNAILGRARRLGLGVHPALAARTDRPAPPAKPDFSKPLPPTGCRFIHGDVAGWATKWCDAPVSAPGESWCTEHRAKVYRPRETVEKSPGIQLLPLADAWKSKAPPQAQRAGTIALAPTVAPMRGER